MKPERWIGLRRIDTDLGLPKGSAFRAFKQVLGELHENTDYRQLHRPDDTAQIEALQDAGEIYASSVRPVVLSPRAAERVIRALESRSRTNNRSEKASSYRVATASRPVYDAGPHFPEPYMSAAELLKKLPSAFQPDAAAGVNCTVQFNCSTPVYVIIKNGTCTAQDGTSSAADVTVTMEDDDLVALMKGELNGMTAFMTGKLQLEGDLMLAQRMFNFFDPAKLG